MIRSPSETRWTLMAVAVASLVIVAVLALHLTIALVAGMLVYIGGRRLSEWLQRRTRVRHPAVWSVAILIALIAGTGSVVVELADEAAATGSGYQGLVEQMAAALEQLRTTLPAWLAAHVPVSLDALRTAAVTWLRDHAVQVRLWGQHTLRGATYVLAGAVVGALAVVQTQPAKAGNTPPTSWVSALMERFALFEQSFGAVVFAQLRIATVNTALTGVYVLAVLPALGAPLPLAFTLVAFTFVASLIPVIGNLLSNTVIVVVSLTQGLGITALSLGFLVAIHKLEYLLNAHIVGSRIRTKAFELLAIMLLFEAMFGLAGLRRPDLIAQRWRVEAARKDIASAKAEFYPNVNLMAFVGLQRLGGGNFLTAASRTVGAEPAVTLPIFDAGRLRSNLAGKDADYDIAVEQYNHTLADAMRDVVDQLASLRSVDEQRRQQMAALATAREAYELALLRYREGLGNYLQVLSAEQPLLAQQSLDADLRARELELSFNLIRALSGGYEAAPAIAAATAP